MKNTGHIIEKVLVDVNSADINTANFIKNNIDLFIKDELFPGIEQLLDLYELQDSVIRFNDFNIELSFPEWKNSNQIKAEILVQFEEKLVSQIWKINEKTDELAQIEVGENIILKFSEIKKYEEVFLYFLQNGYCPWFGTEKLIVDYVEKDIWQKSFDDSDFIHKLTKISRQNKGVFQRFVNQFPFLVYTFLAQINSRLDETLTHILGKSQSFHWKTKTNFLNTLFLISTEKEDLEIIVAIQNWLDYLRVNANNNQPYIVPELSELNKLILKAVSANLIKEPKFQNTLNQLLSFFAKSKKSTVPESKSVLFETSSDPENFTFEKEIESAKIEDIKYDIADSFFDEDIQEIRVQNAGLILLHPFLHSFFSALKIVDKNSGLNKEKLELAVQILHFLATGKENIFEGNLIFEKYLCGIPLKMPVQKESLLTESIRSEVETLLKEVIKNWPALKNTSPDGLREMFFQRDGKLFQKEENFKLIVERKAQDILLERLNWNISIIKLPWKKELLMVEW